MKRTRQSYDLYFLSFRAKNGIKNHNFFEVASGDTNPSFSPRGTQLEIEDGKATKWQCPFHGWTWKLDGTLAHIPCRWDFDHLSDEDLRLPEVKVATWQGFVFINFANECEPLETYLENIPTHFQHHYFPLENRFTSAYVSKIMPANWKVVLR